MGGKCREREKTSIHVYLSIYIYIYIRIHMCIRWMSAQLYSTATKYTLFHAMVCFGLCCLCAALLRYRFAARCTILLTTFCNQNPQPKYRQLNDCPSNPFDIRSWRTKTQNRHEHCCKRPAVADTARSMHVHPEEWEHQMRRTNSLNCTPTHKNTSRKLSQCHGLWPYAKSSTAD